VILAFTSGFAIGTPPRVSRKHSWNSFSVECMSARKESGEGKPETHRVPGFHHFWGLYKERTLASDIWVGKVRRASLQELLINWFHPSSGSLYLLVRRTLYAHPEFTYPILNLT
jgi:hypothetical protein